MDTAFTHVSEPERWVSVVAGTALAAYGLARRSIGGVALAAVGGGLVWYGLSTATEIEDDRRQVSVRYGKGFRVEKMVTINASATELYRFWRNFSNLPRFMSHLQSVTVLDGKRSHWIAKGVPGADAEWDAEIINEIPNELIGWRSVDGSRVNNAGSVHFTSIFDDRATQVRVLLRYDPPAGAVGAFAAKIFGEDPAKQVEEDLEALKKMFES